MIRDFVVGVDPHSNIHIEEVTFPGTKRFWELLTRKKVNKKLVTADDLQRFKKILEMTNVHLEGYNPNANINVSRGLKYRNVISKLLPGATQTSVASPTRREWISY
jgi:hypothetical protein